jgi:predicted ATP-dependent endonuclease of OLD family
MEPIKFRIRNYRSIGDTGDCYFSPNITILAGQNEAGKTSILEALEDFSPSNSIRDEATPINREAEPEITVTFKISGDELEEIIPGNRPSRLDLDFSSGIEITITKEKWGSYSMPEFTDSWPEFEDAIDAVIEGLESDFENLLTRIQEAFDNTDEMNFDDEDVVSLGKKLDNVKNNLERHHGTNNEEADETDVQLEAFEDELNSIRTDYRWVDRIEEPIENNIMDRIPEFVLFDTYDDKIPNEVELNNLHSNEFIQDLSDISDLDEKTIRSGEPTERRKHKKDINVELNDDYSQFWTQDDANLTIDWDSEYLRFWIEEDGQPYEPSLRSKGRIWHLSFYIKLSAHSSGDSNPIVLIDDPGLHLHAKAQEDILEKLEDVGQKTKVVFTTHSPYLIDSEKLNRVWLVRNTDSEGTIIEKLHANANKDTLRPVLTAIGANTTVGIHLDRENQVVTEGISDYHYLQGFREILDWEGDLDVIPGVGGNTPLYIGEILFGWGIDPVFCLDPDDPAENARKLNEKLGIPDERIIYVEEGNGAIEDVFTKEDFKRYVLQDPTKEFESSSNSEYLNRAQADKVLLAKKFYECCSSQEVSLSDDTLENIEQLFTKIDTAMHG